MLSRDAAVTSCEKDSDAIKEDESVSAVRIKGDVVVYAMQRHR
jgi:hypothetical protein